MKIATLEPFLTELVLSLGLKDSLVAIAAGYDFSSELGQELPVTTDPNGVSSGISAAISNQAVDINLLKRLKPDVILTRIKEDRFIKTTGKVGQGQRSSLIPSPVEEAALREELSDDKVRLFAYDPVRLDDIYEMTESLAEKLGVAAKGRERAQRMRAQLMDWGDNFYERTKNKRVTFLANIDPLILGGLWIPDMITMASAVSQEVNPGQEHRVTSWNEIVAFRPDVIVIAPQGKDLKATLKYYTQLSKMPKWDDIPAVKRGEVIFTDGHKYFYRPSPRIIDSMAVLISAIAGFESGYITERESFYRLRWLELNRHKLGSL